MKVRSACKNPQVEKSAIKSLSQGDNRMARVGFELQSRRSPSPQHAAL